MINILTNVIVINSKQWFTNVLKNNITFKCWTICLITFFPVLLDNLIECKEKIKKNNDKVSRIKRVIPAKESYFKQYFFLKVLFFQLKKNHKLSEIRGFLKFSNKLYQHIISSFQ